MRSIVLVLLLAACQSFAADDPSAIAIGDWSEPVGARDGFNIRGRLLICETPNHASSDPTIDTAVYLELQEFSSGVVQLRVYCELNRMTLPDDSPGLRCELRDRTGKPVAEGAGGFSGGMPVSRWVTLPPYDSARLRVSVFGGGRLKDGGLAIYLASRGWWELHPNPTNEYFLSGTFTAVQSYDRFAWFSPEDFVDLPSLAAKLKQGRRPVDSWLVAQTSARIKSLLEHFDGSDSDRESLGAALALALDGVLRGPAIHDDRRFAGIELRAETQALLAKNPQGYDLLRLNRLLIEDAYPLEMKRNLSDLPYGARFPERDVWEGSLKLPKVKIPLKKP